MKYTPAPWKVLSPSTGVDNNWHVTDVSDTFVAHVYGFGHAVDEQSRINANLISAAPELLEVLQFIVDRHAPAVADMLFGEGWVETARRVIDKAQGINNE
jgi:hypothetical protein